jgi:hypothetical protein
LIKLGKIRLVAGVSQPGGMDGRCVPWDGPSSESAANFKAAKTFGQQGPALAFSRCCVFARLLEAFLGDFPGSIKFSAGTADRTVTACRRQGYEVDGGRDG